jgi:hypothetical protein
MMTNSTVIWEGDQPIYVDQGPRWLVDMLVGPPPWLHALLAVALVGVMAMLVYGVAAVDLSPQVVLEAVDNVLIAGCVLLATSALVRYYEFSYVVDIGLGLAFGFCLASSLSVLARFGVARVTSWNWENV